VVGLLALTEASAVTKVTSPTAAKTLERARGIRTVGDLLEYVPRRYLDPGTLTGLTTLVPGMEVVIVAEVRSAVARPMRQRRQRMLTATVYDGITEFDLTFFKAWGHEGKLVPGRRAIVAGTLGRYKGRWQLAHPDYEMLDGAADDVVIDAYTNHLLPLYSTTEKLYSWKVRDAIRLALDSLDEITDPLPPAVRARRGLVDRATAFELIHRPRTRADVEVATHRLRFDEAFTLQTILAQRRRAALADVTTARRPVPGGILAAFDARLPFELTAGQHAVGDVIAAELAQERPMHRLLQGEVGSGKTVVALRAMLAVIDAGGQAALLAPTEVLAAQHHRSITALLGDLADGGRLGGADNGTRVALLTGGQSAAARRSALNDAVTGDAGIVVGTHALIQDAVTFHDLALVVVDEQHRFGVEQRDALRGKGRTAPHVLVMTATPIPRTVAMTVFGDMETSVLSELPLGRSPIETFVVETGRPNWVDRTWARVGEEVAKGHQVYVVCPRIGEPEEPGDGGAAGGSVRRGDVGDPSDGADLVAPPEGEPERPVSGVVDVLAQLRANPHLAGRRVEMLHGRMDADAKDSVMQAFHDGAVDVLVATTVIEVGVDVANATVMVVLDADRFGVSQLHQLRGRVGRGSAKGLCLLMTAAEAEGGAASLDRLRAVAATTDGFELARLDLQTRREGDVLGARQSGGRSQLKLLRILRDEAIIERAREDAFALVEADPDLGAHPLLAARVAAALDEEQAAYLERG
jgi:ATP-dependent DNA helicase RecG